MTWAVHNLHTPPVEVIEDGAARAYRVNAGARELPLGDALHLAGSKEDAMLWQHEQNVNALLARCTTAGMQQEVANWLDQGQTFAFIRAELSKRGV